MARSFLMSLLSVLLAFLLAFCISPRPEETGNKPPVSVEAAVAEGDGEIIMMPQSSADEELILRVLDGGEIRELSMGDYLAMALAGEMPASFEPEALKAQAVALRSYALYYRAAPKSVHPEADICFSPGCCAAGKSMEEMAESWGSMAESYGGKISSAVESTDGEYLVWEDEPALAMFHSCSYGATEHSSELRNPLPYLVSVDSPETEMEVSSLRSNVEISAGDFRDSVARVFPSLHLEGEPGSWLGEVKPSAGGRVGSINIGGQEISGLTMRQIFSLRSTDFSLKWTGEHFLFSVSGYGHGLGLSQYGANTMAKEGSDYAEILSHYYPGTEIKRWDLGAAS